MKSGGREGAQDMARFGGSLLELAAMNLVLDDRAGKTVDPYRLRMARSVLGIAA